MPVSSQVWFVLRHDDEVSHTPRYVPLAAGTRIQLACLVWLNDVDDHRIHRSTQECPEHDAEDQAQEADHDQHIQG